MTARTLLRRRPRAFARAAAVGAAALVLAGCMQADIGVVVNDDESGEMNMRMVFNREQIEAMTEMFDEMDPTASTTPAEDICAEMTSDINADAEGLPEGATVEPIEEDDGWCGANINIPFADLDEFAEIAATMNEGTEEDDAPTGSMALTKTAAGGYRFEVSDLGMSSEAMGTNEEDAAAMGEVFEQMLDDMRISYDVRLPGNPVDHNADVVEGNRFYFELGFGDERADLFAETAPGEPDGSADTGDSGALPDEPGGGSDEGAGGEATGGGADDGDEAGEDDDGSNAWIWIVLGVVALAAVIAAVVLLKRRKGPGEPPVPGQPSPGYVPPAPPADSSPTITAGPAAVAPPPPPVAPPPPPADPDAESGWAPPGSS